MTTNFKFVQAQNFSLAGSGAVAGATSIILKSLTGIDGALLTMTDFGVIGFATIEPGNGTQEEQISFTGITQNANGTATLTGVKTVIFINPYTATSGLAKTHPGSATFIITNTSGFYDQFPAKANDETITGDWTFNGQVTFAIAPISPITNPKATDSVYGIVKLSVAAISAVDPIVVGTNDPRMPIAYAVDAAGSDTYVINPSPAITAYSAGQIFTFKAGTANTGACSLNVNGKGAITIKKNVSADLVTGDILQNQIVTVEYDGTNMQLQSQESGVRKTTDTLDAATLLSGITPIANGGTGRAVAKKSGIIAFNGSSATTTVAHGLGVIPSFVKFTAYYGSGSASTGQFLGSVGTYNGTNTNTIHVTGDNGANYVNGTSTTYVIYLGLATNTSYGAITTFDATNFIITWTNSNSGIVTNILWEAE